MLWHGFPGCATSGGRRAASWDGPGGPRYKLAQQRESKTTFRSSTTLGAAMILVIAAAVIAFLAAFFRWRLRRPLMPESTWKVEFDEASIVVHHPRGQRQAVSWSKLSRVAIRTTDDGPWDMDVFWGLHENGSPSPPAVFPGGATGEQALLEAFGRRLPDFRFDQVIAAMSSTSNAYFVLWEPQQASPPRAPSSPP